MKKTVAKVFIYINMIFCFYLIVPLIVGFYALNKLKKATCRQDLTVPAILTILLSGNLISGIAMLLMNDEDFAEGGATSSAGNASLANAARRLLSEELETKYSNGMQITLPKSLSEIEMEGRTVCYDSDSVAVFALRESYEENPEFEDLTLDEYNDMLADANSERFTQPFINMDYYAVTEYEAFVEDTTYKYYTVTFQTEDAFWMVQFAADVAIYDMCRPAFVEWAKSINFF